jgi:hypothetical protein
MISRPQPGRVAGGSQHRKAPEVMQTSEALCYTSSAIGRPVVIIGVGLPVGSL